MRFLSLLALVVIVGCDQAPPSAGVEPKKPTTEAPTDGNASTGTSETESAASESVSTDARSDAGLGNDGGGRVSDTARCQPAVGTTGAPQTVIEVVQLLNGLPHPVTINCFLEALERPLRILAAASFVSAQPAYSIDNPRIFILGGGMSLSVVPEGDGQNLLEMGELTSNTHSIKAEVEFPIDQTLALDAPFTRIRSEIFPGTVCFGCHNNEVEVLDYPVRGAFDSVAYRPLPDYEVDLDHVKQQFTTCDAELEPERCGFFEALFAHGEVVPDRFPDEMPLFQ